MKKITILLLFVLVSVWGFAQDPSPIPSIMVKKLIAPNNPTFYYDQTDSSVWIYKGLYGWTKLADSARLQKDYVPYENAWRHVNLDTMSIRTGYVDLVAKNNPIHTPYRLFSDTTNHTLAFYNDEEHVTMQIGQEMWSRIYNNGSIALNGKVVRINGSFGKVATIGLASNVIHTSAEGVLGVATHDIETNTYGFITTFGEVHDLNTSMCSEGALLYLGTNGAFTHVRPVSPNFVIEIGTCIYSHATEGKILVNIKGSPHDIIQNAFNGSFMEGMKFTVASNGTTITGSLQLTGGGDLTAIFSDGFTTIDCTPAKTITLTQGSATVPQTNWVYLLKSTKDIAVSTSGWPTDEHIKISEVACRTAAQTLADGALRNQNWNDHLSGTNGMGHLQHVNERVRRIPSDWFSGTELTVNLVSASTPDDIYFNVTGGKVYQMHLQDFPAQSMPTADIHIVNHFTTPFTTVNNINTQLTDALNVTLVNRSFSFVVWGVQNESGENSHLMLNLPIGSYTSSPLAIADASNYSVYTIPSQFRGVGFLIARITMSHSSAGSGTWTINQVQDLRGFLPNNTAGSGAAGSGTGVTTYLALLDTPNTYASSANKIQGVNASETAIESKAATVTAAGTINIPTGQQYQINGGSIVVDSINDTVTTTTSSQNAIFDALALKENTSNKENVTVDNSTTKYPTVNLLKTYADTKDPSSTNELNTSVTFNHLDNTLEVVDAGGTKKDTIDINTALIFNEYRGRITVTANPISFNWPTVFESSDYNLDIYPFYLETIDGKNVEIKNAVYDKTQTASGFSLYVDTIAGYVDYRAYRKTYAETPANIVLQSDSITKYVTPTQLTDSLNTVVRTETDPTIYAWAKSATKPTYTYSEVGAQAPITLTTTGTSGASTLIGATLNIPQYSGGTATGEIWTSLTGTYSTTTIFTITGTDKDVGLLELSLLTCTNSTGATRRIGYVKTATNSGGTITVNVVTDTNLASGDKDFKIAYNRKVTDYMRLVTIPGEQIADASYSQGMFYADIQTNSYLLPVDLSVITAAAGTGAALTINVYKNTTALFSSAPDMATNTVLRSQRPTTNTISAAERVSLRIMSSAGATNKAADFQAKLYIVPQTIYTAF